MFIRFILLNLTRTRHTFSSSFSSALRQEYFVVNRSPKPESTERVLGISTLAVEGKSLQRTGLAIDGKYKGSKHQMLLGSRSHRDDDIAAARGHFHALNFRDVGLATIEHTEQDGFKSSKLACSLGRSHALMTTHNHREGIAIHDKLVLAAIADDSHLVGIFHRKRTR